MRAWQTLHAQWLTIYAGIQLHAVESYRVVNPHISDIMKLMH